MRPMLIPTVKKMIRDKKEKACIAGRFKLPPSAYLYDQKDWLRKAFGFKPARCMGYNTLVREINALEDIVAYVENV